MIAELDRQLTDWVGEVLPGTTVALEGPSAGTTADVGLYLFEIAHLPPARGERRPPLQVELGYLVTTGGADVSSAHDRLGALLFAALQHPDYDVRFPGDMAAYWAAAGVAPQPSFVLAVPLRQEVSVLAAPPVTSALRVQSVGSQSLVGVVVGPGDVSIADAMVEVPSLALATRTDPRGRFRFSAVPVGAAALQIRVRAKSQEFPFTVDSSAPQPVTLKLDLAKG
ncbi:MAG TPA: hypothetical protein VGF66_06295 [Gaiellaceae bacterium]